MHPCPPGKYGTSEEASTESVGYTSFSAGKYCPRETHLPITCLVNAYFPAGASAQQFVDQVLTIKIKESLHFQFVLLVQQLYITLKMLQVFHVALLIVQLTF